MTTMGRVMKESETDGETIHMNIRLQGGTGKRKKNKEKGKSGS